MRNTARDSLLAARLNRTAKLPYINNMAAWGCLSIVSAAILFSWVLPISAQLFSNLEFDEGVNVIRSPANSDITVTYKTLPPGICATKSRHQKQYTGYVHLPPSTIAPIRQDYAINTFFWFVEAQYEPESAPLTIYLNGGPGSSSLVGVFLETGPCEVIELNKDKLGTRARKWSWDRSSNMLFIDQPVQSGFSYDTLHEGSLDLLTSTYSIPPAEAPPDQPSYTFVNGTFSSLDARSTANTTAIAAKSSWHILQAFLKELPQYNPAEGPKQKKRNCDRPGVHLFAESYGGKYAPAFATYWEEQNDKLRSGELSNKDAVEIDLVSIGILQGEVDGLVQNPFYPVFAYNNTYQIQAISEEERDAALKALHQPGGCEDLVQSCKQVGQAKDPEDNGDNEDVNRVCLASMFICNRDVVTPYNNFNRSNFDIAQHALASFPPALYQEYLNQAHVKSAIGTELYYTEYSTAVQNAFISTGDYMRGMYISQIAALLNRGIRVALIYGDRDYVCNWMGGEAVSFSVAASTSPTYTSNFNSAGYAPLVVNKHHIGGATRQFGNLSFTRVYDSGHFTPYYQPEALYNIFERVISGGRDVASGKQADLSTFRTQGERNATKTNTPPPMPEPTCYLRNIPGTCTAEQIEKLKAGKGVIINGVWYASGDEWKGPGGIK